MHPRGILIIDRTSESCGACLSLTRDEIDAALLQAPLRAVASRYGLPKSSLHRHKINHIAGQIAFVEEKRRAVRARAAEINAKRSINTAIRHLERELPAVVTTPLAAPDDVLGELRTLHYRIMEILIRAEACGDSQTSLRAVKEARDTLQLLGRSMGLFDSDSGVKIDQSTRIVNVLAGYTDDELRRFIAADAPIKTIVS